MTEVWQFLFSSKRRRSAPRGQRREPRFPAPGLKSPLGPVVDLSGRGVRIHGSGRPTVSVGDVIRLTLTSKRDWITLTSRVVRVKRVGLRRFDVGLEFVNPEPGLRAALQSLARDGYLPKEKPAAPTETATARATATATEDKPARPAVPAAAVPDYYGLLHLRSDATPAQVRTAYHAAAKHYHPDASRSPDQLMLFQAVSEAYRTLRDPQKRRDYDARRHAGGGAGGAKAA